MQLKFENERLRLQHPQCKLIPRRIWFNEFDNKISESDHILIQTPIKEFLSNQKLLDTHQHWAEHTWICIFLGNPGALVEDLIQVATLLKLSSQTLLYLALALGSLSIIKSLIEKEPQLIEQMIQAQAGDNNYNGLQYAAELGHLDVLRYVEEKAPALIKKMIQAENYKTFRYAVEHGDLAMLRYLEEKAPELIEKMIQAEDYQAFRDAAQEGDLAMLRYLEEKAPALIEKMIQAVDYQAFRNSAKYSHLEVLRHLEEKAPELIEKMIQANDYQAFRYAAEHGHLEVLRYLEVKAPALIEKMIQAKNYKAFCMAACNGHLEVIRHLEEKVPTLIEKMIQAKNYEAFLTAACNGHLEVLRHFEEEAPALILEMIQADNYQAFRVAADNGHLEVLRHFEEEAPALILEMVQAKNYQAFQYAAERGHLEVLRYLEEKAPTLIKKMIQADNYEALYQAVYKNHLEVLRHLAEKAPTLIQEMIQADNYDVFRSYARDDRQVKIQFFLLSHYSCFAYAEQHYSEYQTRIDPFVIDKLVNLRARRQNQENINPNIVFDLNEPNEIRLCFYIIRNLIRRNDPSLDDDLRFFIQIPAVRALLHATVTPNNPNELLRLAFNLGNDNAARMLLTVPAVRELAELNNFYRQEAREGRDLRDLAQDHESSMNALTQGEQKRMKAVLNLYQPIINQTSVPVLMKQLREQLLTRYTKNPAKILVGGKERTLPATWDELNALKLKKPEYDLALKGYYQNKDHSAWRYFLKPNPWMAENAAYVQQNPNNPHERHSTFEEYQPLIIMLWLAAQDEKQAPTDNHTVAGRLTHFIDELAHLGRAHNWDKSRKKEGTAIEEEYDDLEGDKPSCYSGVKRRLFQSVVGHPLLKILTIDDLKQELRSFVRDHVVHSMNKGNKEQLKQAYQDYIISLDLVDAAPLKALDICEVKQDEFIESLEKKYGAQFSEETSFRYYIISTLNIPKDSPQVLDLFGVAKLDDLFAPSPEKVTTQIALTYQEKLKKCGALGVTILLQIERLQQAEHSLNPYWINSTKKLNAIIHSIDSISPDINEKVLNLLVKNPETELYQALNIQRLSPLTFLGRLGWNHAKSLQVVQEVSSRQHALEIH